MFCLMIYLQKFYNWFVHVLFDTLLLIITGKAVGIIVTDFLTLTNPLCLK